MARQCHRRDALVLASQPAVYPGATLRPVRSVRGIGTAVVAGAALLASAGCAGNEYSLDDGVRDLQRDVGLSESQAECVIDGLEDRIGSAELRGFSEATSDQRDLVTGLMNACAGEEGVSPTSDGG